MPDVLDLDGIRIGGDSQGEEFIGAAEVQTLTRKLEIRPSQFVEFFVNVVPGETFTFTDREYLIEVYDGDSTEVLLKAGRQVEKTVSEDTGILCADGVSRPIKDLTVGCEIWAVDQQTNRVAEAEVTWKSKRYKKPCVSIFSRGGLSIVAGEAHPFFRKEGDRFRWVPASVLGIGDEIAVARLTPSGYVVSLDTVERLERPGLRWCYDISTTLETFVANGFVTHNSTTLGNICLYSAIALPGCRVLYVSPSDRQTKTFSFERIRGTILNSPRLRDYIDPGSMNVYDQVFLTKSVVKLRSCYLTPDRLRGERADIVIVDEYQDILAENLPVIRECTFHADPAWRRFYYGGTPKTLDNPIERLWRKSSMTELMYPCRAHGETNRPWTWHWFPITVDCLGKSGLICPRCGKPVHHLDPKASWVDTAPSAEVKVRGYHIPQPITPMAHRVPEDWRELLTKLERYPTGKFMNEVMGESYDHGVRPISETDLVSIQVPDWTMGPEQLQKVMRLSAYHPVYAGIDWGGEDFSYTVIVLGTYALNQKDNRFFQFYWHRFEGKETDKELQLERIYDLLRGFNVRYCIADYGMGGYQNDWLVRRLSAKKYGRMQYVGKQQGKIVWRPKLGWFTAHRTAVITDFISAVKKGKIAIPSWSVFADPYGQDFLNLRGEYNERRNEIVYTHGAESPTDSFHASLYCLTASLRDFPRPDITHLTVDESVADPLVLEDPTMSETYLG